MEIDYKKIATSLTIVAGVLGGGTVGVNEYRAYNQQRWADHTTTLMQHLEEERDDADENAKQHAETAYHYCSKVDRQEADEFDRSRCRYSKERAEHFQNEVKRYQNRIDKLKDQ